MSFADGRGQFPDKIGASVPRGFREQVKRAATIENVPTAEFIRRAIDERLQRISNIVIRFPGGAHGR